MEEPPASSAPATKSSDGSREPLTALSRAEVSRLLVSVTNGRQAIIKRYHTKEEVEKMNKEREGTKLPKEPFPPKGPKADKVGDNEGDILDHRYWLGARAFVQPFLFSAVSNGTEIRVRI